MVQQDVFGKQRELVMALQRFGETQHALTLEAQQRVLQAQQQAQYLLWGIGTGVFLLGLVLGFAVTRAISRAEKVLAHEKAQADHAARHDPLTGLLNRRGFEDALARWRERDALTGGTHTLVLIDLDKFKPVNDQAGHAAGDALLKRLAGIFRDNTRPLDLVARLGGDEFAVVLHGLDAEPATQVAERIRQAVQDFTFEWEGRQFRLGASMGLVAFSARVTPAEWSEVMRHADEACYQAKRAGRNRVCQSSM
jgi:diguanylate cyclase (GGDEF)-like protein